MKRSILSRLSLLATLGLITVLLALAAPAPAAQETLPDRPIPGLSEALDHYTGDPIPPAGLSELPLQAPLQGDTVPWSKLVYQAVQGDDWELFIANGDGTGSSRLTYATSYEIHPRLNRGATHIVYASNSDGDYEIYAMDTNGYGVTQLTNNNADDVNPDWSPDSAQIVFESYRDGQPEIYVMNANGSGQTRLTNDPDYDGMPTWSPGGLRIAFSSRRTGGYRIYTITPAGENLTQLSNQPISLYPTWSSDAAYIAYSADEDGDGFLELWRMNSSGSGQVLVENPSGQVDAWARSWSADSRYIGYTRISFIFYQGNWYWVNAYLYGHDITNGSTIQMINEDAVWNPGWQTTDNLKPTSTMNPLPAQSTYYISLSWFGSDPGPSGLRNYDLEYKDGSNGSWTTYFPGTPSTSVFFYGIGGHTYYFRVRARDNAGNLENWPASHDAVTTVEALAPASTILPLPAYSYRDLTVRWGGVDVGGSGIVSYDVQYKQGSGGSWTNWQSETTATSAEFSGAAGQTYYFRVRARDNAHNLEAYPEGNGDATTTLYNASLNGLVTDNAGVPVISATVTTNPAALGSITNHPAGNYSVYLNAPGSTYTANWAKSGYGSLPITTFDTAPFTDLDIVLPPADNVVQNPGFEDGSLANWQSSGLYAPVYTDTSHHTGEHSAFFGLPFTISEASVIPETTSPHRPNMVMDEEGITHLIWDHELGIGLRYSRLVNGVWSEPFVVAGNTLAASSGIVVEDSGAVHIFWLQESSGAPSLYHRIRQPNGVWTTPALVKPNSGTFQLAIDESDTIHVLVIDDTTGTPITTYYMRRPVNGSWSAPQITPAQPGVSYYPRFDVTNEGVPHIVWHTSQDAIVHSFRNSSGTWSPPQTISESQNSSDIRMVIDSQDRVHVIWSIMGSIDDVFYVERSSSGVWTSPLELSGTIHAIWPQLEVSPQGDVHVIWIGQYGEGVYHRSRDTAGEWSDPVELPETDSEAEWPDLTVDEAGTVYVAYAYTLASSDWDVYLSYRPRGGDWQAPLLLDGDVTYTSTNLPIQIVSGPAGNMQAYWYDQIGVTFVLSHAGSAIASQAGAATLAQTIHLSNTVTAPALSFLHQLVGMSAGNDFAVTIHYGSSPTTLLESSQSQIGWAHQSYDLSDWLGETITLTFQLNQAAGAPHASALLDEVTIGSTHPDVWLAVSGNQFARPGQQVIYTMTYSNRGAAPAEDVNINALLPAGLTFVSATVPPATTSPLVWNVGDLAAGNGPDTIEVTLLVNPSAPFFTDLTSAFEIAAANSELETSNNLVEFTTFVGNILYLPVINR